MAYTEPTYEEYRKSTKLERYANRASAIFMIMAWLALVFIIIWMIMYTSAVKKDPLQYGAEKHNVTCSCWNYDEDKEFMVNAGEEKINITKKITIKE